MNSSQLHNDLTIGGVATLACLMEVAAPKPGNVHRAADFADTTFYDFQTSAVVLGQTIDRCLNQRLGKLILESAHCNRRQVGKNTNLGMILLLCPLAQSVKRFGGDYRISAELTQATLNRLDQEDCSDVYQAIGLTSPGGLGESDKMDVTQGAPNCLVEAMRVSEDRDLVARQYSRNFETIFEHVIPLLIESRKSFELQEAIVVAHVTMMARFPDSLIARKCGEATAVQSQQHALRCLDQLQSPTDFWKTVQELDFWLRSDGNRRNPGTTADLIAAGLFTMMINGEFGDG